MNSLPLQRRGSLELLTPSADSPPVGVERSKLAEIIDMMYQIDTVMQKLLQIVPTRREVGLEERRQRICRAARNLISSGGIGAFSMRKLADEAQLSVNTLYNLVGGRDEILLAVLQDCMDELDRTLERESPIEDPIERCHAIVELACRTTIAEPHLSRALIRVRLGDVSREFPEATLLPEQGAAMQSRAIEEAIAQGLLRDSLDPGILGAAIYRGWEAAAELWALGRVDAAGFRVRALYALYLALLAVATNELRPHFESKLQALERKLYTP